MMEDKLIKYLYKEGSKEEIIALEKEINKNQELAASLQSVEAVDQMFKSSNSFNFKMEASFEVKLKKEIKTQMSKVSKPLIVLPEENKNNYFNYLNYAVSAVFTIFSIAYIYFEGGFKLQWNEGMLNLPNTIVMAAFFTSFCLLFFYFLDRHLSEGKNSRSIIPCI